MSKPNGSLKISLRLLFWGIFIGVALYLIAHNLGILGNVVIVIIGFGLVVLVHEFGHFIAAKLSGINVQAFSIGFPPIALGFLRTEGGFRIRVLPDLLKKKDGTEEKERLAFTIGKKGRASETEYRIGLIPFGGFVKMLGQEDFGQAAGSQDPRSFAKKRPGVRLAVIAAGVVFNVISAVILFMTAFLIGIKLPPAVIGDAVPGYPAAEAGLTGGDEIIAVGNRTKDLDYSDIDLAAALADDNEEIPLKVRHQDGSVEQYYLTAKRVPSGRLKTFGTIPPLSLEIAKPRSKSDIRRLESQTGLRPGDKIRSVAGKDVQNYWQFAEIVSETFASAVAVLAERKMPSGGESELIETQIPLDLAFAGTYEVGGESELYHIFSMLPRLKITMVVTSAPPAKERLGRLIAYILGKRKQSEPENKLEVGDILLAIGEVTNPSYYEVRRVIAEHDNKELVMKVLRKDAEGVEKTVTVTVKPKRRGGARRPTIGIRFALDAEHPVVAKTIDTEGLARLAIPSGATITAVNGTKVSDFYGIINNLKQDSGAVKIDYHVNGEDGSVVVEADEQPNRIKVKSDFEDYVPFKALKKTYEAQGPVEAILMGLRKTTNFMSTAYATLSSLFKGQVSAHDLVGPVGIVQLSYEIVSTQPLIYYVYFIGLLSAIIAVFNFLPLPPLDGGLAVFLLIEKLKGSAVNAKVQSAIVSTGWVLIGALVIYVTFNDIVRMVGALF